MSFEEEHQWLRSVYCWSTTMLSYEWGSVPYSAKSQI